LLREKEVLAEAQRKNIKNQVKHQSIEHWENDQLAIQILHDAWCANVKADRVKGLIKIDKKAVKKE